MGWVGKKKSILICTYDQVFFFKGENPLKVYLWDSTAILKIFEIWEQLLLKIVCFNNLILNTHQILKSNSVLTVSGTITKA